MSDQRSSGWPPHTRTAAELEDVWRGIAERQIRVYTGMAALVSAAAIIFALVGGFGILPWWICGPFVGLEVFSLGFLIWSRSAKTKALQQLGS